VARKGGVCRVSITKGVHHLQVPEEASLS
jgi:hypothetical protein